MSIFKVLVPIVALIIILPVETRSAGVRQVLVLQSYNERYLWTASINDGILSELESDGWDIWYEYLDAKNLSPGFDDTAFDRLFREKYSRLKFDGIITVDDPAYNYFLRTRESVFHGMRGVSLGLNSRPKRLLDNFIYIFEEPEYGLTLNYALSQSPKASTVHIVVDGSITGKSITQVIRNESLSRPVTFNFITRGSPDDIVRECSKISRDDVLVYAVYFDPQVGYVSNDNLLRAIRSQVDMPVYTFWSFNMAAGATGGYLYDGHDLGREGARCFRMQTAGFLWSSAPVISRWAFDAAQVRRYSLDLHGLKDVILLKKPPSFWEANRTVLLGSVGVILILLIIMSLIYVNFRIQKRLVASGAEKIGVQKELMAILGDVIEKRSGETGSHVQRVTLLSLRLAELLGLSDEHREHLEICASMHDIGKIAIPDAILLKPGRLDPDEERVMRTHPVVGHLIFRHHESPIFAAATTIAFEHHERWDGTGYPMGKKGEEIHILARIVSIVDVFDALLSERPYKRAWTPDEVKSLITEESGRSFDPVIADMFLSHLDEFISIRDSVTE